jgi:hypothetical protein
MGKDKLWSSTSVSIGHIIIPFIHKYLPRTISSSAIPLLLTDDTSILIADANVSDFVSKLSSVFNIISE